MSGSKQKVEDESQKLTEEPDFWADKRPLTFAQIMEKARLNGEAEGKEPTPDEFDPDLW